MRYDYRHENNPDHGCCADCKNWHKLGGRCTILAGKTSPGGICDRFDPNLASWVSVTFPLIVQIVCMGLFLAVFAIAVAVWTVRNYQRMDAAARPDAPGAFNHGADIVED